MGYASRPQVSGVVRSGWTSLGWLQENLPSRYTRLSGLLFLPQVATLSHSYLNLMFYSMSRLASSWS